MAIEKSSPEELLIQFRDNYQKLAAENQQLAQKIKENEAVALKLLGAIEALQYLEETDEDVAEQEEEE